MQITDEKILQLFQQKEFKNAYEVEKRSDHLREDARLKRDKENCENICKKMNQLSGSLNKLDGYNCELCMNRGYTLVPERNGNTYSQRMVLCTCRKIRDTIARFNQSGLQDVVRNCTFDKYIAKQQWQKDILSTARKYLKSNDNAWFFIGGQSGCGKTHICTAITAELIERGNDARYMLWREESSNLKAIATGSARKIAVNELCDIDVLYIDDLFKTGRDVNTGKMVPTSADINLAFEIINGRYIKNKITVISSECSLEEIANIDEATGGRIIERCKDYRINIAKDKNKNYRLNPAGRE